MTKWICNKCKNVTCKYDDDSETDHVSPPNCPFANDKGKVHKAQWINIRITETQCYHSMVVYAARSGTGGFPTHVAFRCEHCGEIREYGILEKK